ncbi:hypothetical protein ASF10_02705 [Flavobacterium sp. Leaf82]|uniref:hypothetical protein n=1 Tax=unclassified Flavobacterium TaxID=196869 RepID=UPI0006F61B13|nr:hypothetical protein [Flavobacterium sp. Leaf82]KQO34641.1 hypothetical protein ASF10_02705 [Flavobacterium sp. Leaf82]
MNEKRFFKIRVYFTSIIAISIWALLIWNHYHGGVPSHHILNDKNLPEISNWWGALLLPLLSWILFYRIKKRAVENIDNESKESDSQINIIYGFIGALFSGILLSVFFTLGYANFPAYVLLLILMSGLFFPIYRAEYILGFVLGMTFTFGAVLPTVIAFILALIGAFLYLCIRTLILYVVSRILFVLVSSDQKEAK